MVENRPLRRWWIAAGTAFALVPVLFYLLVGGRVTGSEFSPNDFSRRQFSYNIMPWLKIPIRGIEYRDVTPVFEQILVADGLLENTGGSRQWHLISDSVSDPRSPDFDARFLCRYLDLQDASGQCFWIRWNDQYAQLAVEFWPIIAHLARSNLYLDIAAIMQRAVEVTKDDVSNFRKDLRETASSALLQQGEKMLAAGRDEAAIACLERSIAIRPSQAAVQARDASYRRLGQQPPQPSLPASENDPINPSNDRETDATDLSGQ